MDARNSIDPIGARAYEVPGSPDKARQGATVPFRILHRGLLRVGIDRGPRTHMTDANLKKNIGALFVLQGANYLLPLVTLPYLVRVLGAETFGRIAFAQALIAYFVFLTEYGFNLSATRAVAQTRQDPEALSRLASAVMIIKSAIMLAGFMLLIAIVFSIPEWRADWPLFAWTYLAVVGSVSFPLWLFQGLERMLHITLHTLLARLVIVVATFGLVRETADYHLAAALQAGAMVLAGLIAHVHLPRIVSIKWTWPGGNEIRRMTREGSHVFVASFAGNVANSSNVFFLGLVAAPAVVGYFAAAEKLIRALQGLIYPVSQAVYPHVARVLERSYDDAIALVSRLARTFSVGAASVSLLVFVFANQITGVMYGDGFRETADIMRLMSSVPLLVALNNIFGAQTLAQFGFGKLLVGSTVLPTIIHVVSLYFVAVRFGASGVAWLVVFTEFLILIIRTFGLGYQRPEMLKRIIRG